MISMRYAASLVAGHGLVWNPGERVEGYTNFLWTLVMAVCHLPGLDPSHTCLLIQILGVPVLWLILIATLYLARACRLVPWAASFAVILVGAYYDLAYYSLVGMETGLVAAVVTLALAGTVQGIQRREGRWTPMLWLAVGVLIRPDVAWLAGLAAIGMGVTAQRGRWRILAGLGGFAAVVIAHTLWRHQYYGEWLPNTYYLKATGWPLAPRLLTGVERSVHTVVTLAAPTVLAAIPAFLRPRPWRLFLVAALVLTLCYQVYVGGDFLPQSRHIMSVVPALCVLAADGILFALSFLFTHRRSPAGKATAVALAAVAVIAMNALNRREVLLLRPPGHVPGAVRHVQYALTINRLTSDHVVVALGAVGTIPYYAHGRYVDILGKCDPPVARLPAHPSPRLPGHNKWDTEYTIATYRPDIYLHGLPDEPCFTRDYFQVAAEIDGVDIHFSVRRGSRKIDLSQTRRVDREEAFRALRKLRQTLMHR
jgi:hypothetical protein